MAKSLLISTEFFKSHLKKIFAFIVIVFLLIVIKNMITSIFELQNNSQIVSRLKNEELEQKKREQFLNEQLYYVKSNEFVEKQARERLGMVKEGEYIVLAPPSSSDNNPTETKENTPNWKKWLEMFF